MTTDERARRRMPGRAGLRILGMAAAVVVGLLVPACSDGDDGGRDGGRAGGTDETLESGDEPSALVIALDGRPDLAEGTETVLGELAGDTGTATTSGRAEVLAAQIADAVLLADEVLPDDAAFEEQAGGPAGPRFAAIGGVVGGTQVALAEIDGEGGEPVESLAYVVRMGRELADRLEPGTGADAPLRWILPDEGALGTADRADVAELLSDGDDRAAAEHLLDTVDGLDAAAATEALAEELAAFVPVTNEDDLLTRFLDAYAAATGDGA